jgi:hypothetical protein
MKKIAIVVVVAVVGFGVWWLQRPAEVPPPVVAAPVLTPKANVTPAAPALTSSAGAAVKTPALTRTPPPASTTMPAGEPPARPANAPTMADLLLGGNRIFDAALGLQVTYPEGWGVRNVLTRWGRNNGENTIFFAPPDANAAQPSLYYRKYSDGQVHDLSDAEATLRGMAREKEASRLGDGGNDYKNDPDSFVFRRIDGNPSLSYFATYTDPNGAIHAEYFLRILGPTGYVMFFTRGPVKDVQALIPPVYKMAGTVKPP